jgi:hypothetical protein
MGRSITLHAVALIVFSGLIAPVRAGSISGTFDGNSTLTPTGSPGKYMQSFSGDGDDTTFGAFTATSQSTIDFSDPPLIVVTTGMITQTFSFGSLSGSGSGSGMGDGKGHATFTADFTITGGTGSFAGAMGDLIITGTITQTSSTTEAIDASYTGTLTGVPVPGTLTLLVPAVAIAGMLLVQRRRRV